MDMSMRVNYEKARKMIRKDKVGARKILTAIMCMELAGILPETTHSDAESMMGVSARTFYRARKESDLIMRCVERI